MWKFFDERARRLGILDTKLVQGTAFFFALVVASLFPEIMEIGVGWFIALVILFAVKPCITFFKPNT